MPPQTDESLLTIAQVADLYHCSTRTIARLAADGKLESVKLGKRMKRFRPEAVRAFLAEARAATVAAK